MPIYEYACTRCGETLEISQKISEPPLSACPKCGGPVQKLVSRTSFQLKGGGWYKSDYKKPAGASASSVGDASEKTAPAPTSPDKKPGGSEGGNCGHKH